MRMTDLLLFLREKRPCVDPNAGFWKQLLAWERKDGASRELGGAEASRGGGDGREDEPWLFQIPSLGLYWPRVTGVVFYWRGLIGLDGLDGLDRLESSTLRGAGV